ncbi:permease [Leptospira soteropolitanensis]|uniref:permease n=1 Tax=Leptospira soteropolitanensis TaxID=2950025 RepID=UPI00223D64ED|nr:permease [Leptospira soteropolitanensis]MCW7491273.1 permease [Leptospira soteropolitanensis]
MISYIKLILLLICLVLAGVERKAEPNTKTTPNPSPVSDAKRKDKTNKITKLKPKKIPTETLKLKNEKGYWKPMKIVWDESSGAVAPEFRFAKQFQLETEKNRIILSRRVVEKGKLILNESKEIAPQKYQKWMESLFLYEINHLPMEDVPKVQMTGVSYNYVSFYLESTKSKFYYQLEDRNNPEWNQKNSIIQIIERMKP